MKRLPALFVILALTILTGCGDRVDREAAMTRAPTEAPTAQIAQAAAFTPEPTADAAILPTEEAADPNFFDVDLTGMNATMVYSYVFSIVTDPAQYVGQRFRIKGTYEMTYWSATELNYHFVVVADATACCAQGIEFVLDDGLSYPAEGDQIELTGTFDSYEELDETYYYIKADSVRSWE